MKTLAIITTTYNRDYCIHQVYDSLKSQKSKDFMWLVIDDGSTDNTKDIIDEFIKENLVEIKYYWHPNKGMHGARNLAYDKVDTEINVIIDSDDWLANDAVNKIIDFWKRNKEKDIAGIISLNCKPDGTVIGGRFPKKMKKTTVTEMSDKLNMRGDKKFIYRSELTSLYPYPEIEGENYFPASYKFRMLDLNYKMLIMNEVTCVVDYNDNSATLGRINQYKTCAKGFSFYRNEMIRISKNPKYIVKQTIHYIATSLFSKDRRFINKSHKKLYTIILLPVGIAFYFYLKHTSKKSLNFKFK